MLLVYGVGFHHSGIAPPGRRIIELLVKQGKLRYCVATMGLSIGINFSVKSTMISDFRRPEIKASQTTDPVRCCRCLVVPAEGVKTQ